MIISLQNPHKVTSPNRPDRIKNKAAYDLLSAGLSFLFLTKFLNLQMLRLGGCRHKTRLALRHSASHRWNQMLNHGDTQTYLIFKPQRSAILIGSAIMLKNRKETMTYRTSPSSCKKRLVPRFQK